jgi:hypothetical protein
MTIFADPHGGPNWRAFFEELAAGGFIDGTNLQVDRRRPDGFGYSGLASRRKSMSLHTYNFGKPARKYRIVR